MVAANFKVVRPGEAGTKGWAKLMLIKSKFTSSGFQRERPCHNWPLTVQPMVVILLVLGICGRVT